MSKRAKGRARDADQSLQGIFRQTNQPGPSAAPAVLDETWGPCPLQAQPITLSQMAAMSAEDANEQGGAGYRDNHRMADVVEEMKTMSIGSGDSSPNSEMETMERGRPLEQAVSSPRHRDNEGSNKGSSGQTINLTANYFKILSPTDWCLYHYHVDFSPEVNCKSARISLLCENKSLIGGYIFDGKMMFTSHKLSQNPMEVFSAMKSDGVMVRITIKLISDLAFGDPHYIELFKYLEHHFLSDLKLQPIGKDFFDATEKSVLSHRLQLWPGYRVSIRLHGKEILMCVEIIYEILHRGSVLNMLEKCANSDDYKSDFKELIVGKIVITVYDYMTYRVDDVDFSKSPRSTFSKDGLDITYLQYFKERYGINVNDEMQPLLVTSSTSQRRQSEWPEIIYLIPELSHMTGLTHEIRNKYQLMRGLNKLTKVEPACHITKLLDLNLRMMATTSIVEELKCWDLKLSDQLVTTHGRQLELEKIYCGGTQLIENKFADWTAGMESIEIVFHGWLKNLIVICPINLKRDAFKFLDAMQCASKKMKFQLPNPQIVDIPDDYVGTYVSKLEQILRQCQPDLIMCLVNNTRAEKYNAIKKKCCIERPVPTQIIKADTIRKQKYLPSIASNVVIQIICKTGGVPWQVTMPVNGLMVVGIAVCPDSVDKSKSYGTLVASIGDSQTHYYSAVSEHSTEEKMINGICDHLINALRRYMYKNDRLPTRIVIYRDAVGEVGVNPIVMREVETIQDTLYQVYGYFAFHLAYVIVTEQSTTRFFDGLRNPGPGTIVDDVVTLPDRYEFFLVSQSAKDRNIPPTSYNVVFDNVGLTPDILQRLTYKLTHLCYNCSKTAHVPAPLHYAHKLALLVGNTLHAIPKTDMDNSLYFI